MTLRQIEMAIVIEAAFVLTNRKLRIKDLREWKNAEFAPMAGEIVVEVDALGTHWWAAFPKECDKR